METEGFGRLKEKIDSIDSNAHKTTGNAVRPAKGISARFAGRQGFPLM